MRRSKATGRARVLRPEFDGPARALGGRLQDLRCLKETSQLSLADRLGVGQTALSHMERRDDLLVSTVRDYVEALGGRLHVSATFLDGTSIALLGEVGRKGEGGGAGGDPEWVKQDQLCLPTILEPRRPHPSRDVIFSIRPTYAEKILDGTKTVELRRRFVDGIRPGTLALIYTTSPTSALTGFARIREVQRLPLRDLWERHEAAACLGKVDFEAYFSGVERGYAIMLESAEALLRPVGLPELRERFGFEPPQSFQYVTPVIRDLIAHGRA